MESSPLCQQVDHGWRSTVRHRLKTAPASSCRSTAKQDGRTNTTSSPFVPYWRVRGSLTLHSDLLLYGDRIVIPAALQQETLHKIHEGHQGIERCRERVKGSVWWPGVSNDTKQVVQQCPVCTKEATLRKEPLMTMPLPTYPWQVVSSDLFERKGSRFLLVVDSFSRYPEVIQMTSTTSAAIISAMKSVFSRHGIPETVRSDNGPQYA